MKLYVIAKTLQLRHDRIELFRSGDYLPLEVQGHRADHVCSFSRGNGGRRITVAVGRFYYGLTGGTPDLPCGAPVWGDTAVLVPFADEGRRFRDLLTGQEVALDTKDAAQTLSCAALFQTAPLALLEEVS